MCVLVSVEIETKTGLETASDWAARGSWETPWSDVGAILDPQIGPERILKSAVFGLGRGGSNTIKDHCIEGFSAVGP